jgi:hypothetical protein
MDPHCMFVDDDDDDEEMDSEVGPFFEDNDETRHRIQDTKSIPDVVRLNRKRANQDEGKEVAPVVRLHKRRKQIKGEIS